MTNTATASLAELGLPPLTKAEIRRAREYDRKMEAAGAGWKLELVLSHDGEQTHVATVAQFKKRADFTPTMRRRVITAARQAVK